MSLQPALPSTSFSPSDQVVLGLGGPALRQAIRELCRTDFLVFQKIELGFELGPQHHLWADHLKTQQDVVEMAPRDHGKSHSLVRAYALWKAKYDPWTREIIILGPDLPTAIENLDKMRAMMELAPTLAELMPTRRGRAPDSRSEMELGNGKNIKAKGWGSPLRGRHPQLIIMDDVVNELNSHSDVARKEMSTRFNQVIIPMKDKGTESSRARGFNSQIVVVGTAQDGDDLYHELQRQPEYVGDRLEAIVDEAQKKPLWHARYSYDDLMAIKRRVGSLAFSKEYMNRPLSDETTIFPTSLFIPCFDETLSYARNYLGPNPVYLGADFSVPGSTDGDWTVIGCLEYDRKANLFTLLNYWRERPDLIMKQIEQIEYYCQMFKVTLGLLEDNLFQGIYREHFRTRTTLPLRGHTVNSYNKRSLETGVLSLRPVLENQQMRFPYKTDADKMKTDLIVSEFNGVRQRLGRIGNETTHDDCVMMIWHAITAARGTSFSAEFM